MTRLPWYDRLEWWLRGQDPHRAAWRLAIGGMVLPFLGLGIPALIVAVVARRREARTPAVGRGSRRLLVVASLGVLLYVVLAGLFTWHAWLAWRARQPRIGFSSNAEIHYFAAKCEYLTEYLRLAAPDARVLLLDWRPNKYQVERHRIVQRTLGSLAKVTTHTLVPPEEAAATGEPYRELDHRDFDLAIAAHPECNLVVSMLGLPMDQEKMAIWHLPAERRPRLALVDAYSYDLYERFLDGTIEAMLQYHPRMAYNPYLYRDLDRLGTVELFQRHDLLVTPRNAAALDRRYPGLFQPGSRHVR